MITVNTNMASIIAQNSFNKCSNAMNKALGRLSTGYRINSAKDDAAGSAIAAKLETKISSYAQATKNAEMGADYLQSADSTLSTMQSMVQRMRDLTEQAANGTYGDDERKAIQSEINGLTKELYRIKNTTEFNGKKILGEEEEPILKPSIMISAITNLDTVADGTVIGISTHEELEQLATMTNTGQDTTNLTFVLTNDIDMGSVDASGSNHTAIGSNFSFKGTFDGNGYTISNLKMTDGVSYKGIFNKVENATIKNINLENAILKGNLYCGGLIGQSIGSTIENCTVSNVSITGVQYVGGLVGRTENTNILNCNAIDVNIKNDDSATGSIGAFGSLVGAAAGSTNVENCTATGNIKSTGNQIGGFIGTTFGGAGNENTIKNCYSSANVEGILYVGGFIGMLGSAIVDNCTSSSNSIICNLSNSGAFIGIGNYSTGGEITVTNCEVDTSIYKQNPTINKTGWVITGSQIDAVANPQSPVVEPEEPQISVETNLQVGIQADELSTISIDTGFAIGNFKVDVSTDKKAQKSLAKIDKLLGKMTSKRTDIGASFNRLDSVMSQQETMRTSMTSALSQIKDADIAKESANYVKNQILQQTTASLLATANQNPNIALNLL